jgi:3-isopropylmalate/(R)-2-methylmalate dehydratase small subunit
MLQRGPVRGDETMTEQTRPPEVDTTGSGITDLRGPCICFGDNVSTDEILPSEYMQYTDVEFLATKAMAGIRPSFYGEAQALGGCVVVAGADLGIGSSREQAPDSLKGAGVRAVVAESIQELFFENACNVGLPALEVPGLRAENGVMDGDVLQVDIEAAVVRNLTRGTSWSGTPLPEHALEKLRKGGLMPMLRSYIVKHGMDRPYEDAERVQT